MAGQNNIITSLCSCVSIFLLALPLYAAPWVADTGDGYYKNPILFADYSDPDIVRVNDDFYMVASSFNAMPGIPVLHSKDLVNWRLIGHVYDKLPFEKFDKPAHGFGSWAPSIRFHKGLFYVYFCTPHTGLFVATAKKPEGPWHLQQMASVELWEDPAPFWDEDGQAYLVRGKVRADILYLHKMSADGKRLLDDGKVIYHNVDEQPVIEGPKMMKKDGYYYIHAPAGGVPTGWQAALRSKSIYGPYESKVVLHTGPSNINGPHQGGLVELASGEWWFAHFQDLGVYGRIVHLQPVQWKNGWPLMGEDLDGDGIGEPVARLRKPNVGREWPVSLPQRNDEFDTKNLGLQWQWHANPKNTWFSLNKASKGKLRLYATQNLTQNGNLYFSPNLLLQKFDAPAFSATTKIQFTPHAENDKSGLVVMGQQWAYLALVQGKDRVRIGMFTGIYDRNKDGTVEQAAHDLPKNPKGVYEAWLRVNVLDGGLCEFSYSLDGENFSMLGETFQATVGVWIGAKVGLFAQNPSIVKSEGYADFDWMRLD